jgi:hypothetical protein
MPPKNRIIKHCKCCGKPFETTPSRADKSMYCSRECKWKPKEKNPKYYKIFSCELCGNKFDGLISRNPRFCSNSCSAKFTANDPDRLKKIRTTKKEKYGSETFVNPEKAKKTNLERYGVTNPSKTDDVKQKIMDTMHENYNGKHYFQTDGFKQHMIDTYGVSNMLELDWVQDKIRNSCIERYGVENVFAADEIKEQIKLFYQTQYGENITSAWKCPDVISKRVINQKINKFGDLKYQTLSSEYNVIPLFDLDTFISNSYTDKVYEFKCVSCGTVFTTSLKGNFPRCQVCYPTISSVHETEIFQFIQQQIPNTEIIQNDRKLLGGKEIDILIPDNKIGIEYDSFYYHSESHIGKKYHLDKTNDAEANGFKLIHIFEDEWMNKKDIVKSKLKSMLHVASDKIFARKCSIKTISNSISSEFLNLNHIQGKCNSPIRYGAYYDSKLVAVMTFGKPRIALGGRSDNSDTYELVRFATSQHVIGIAGKLHAHFIKEFNPIKIISFADKRFSSTSSNVYQKLGFELEYTTNPNYWYFKNGYPIKYHRYGFRKQLLKSKLELFDPSLTEYENMKQNGYDRIWDCGNLKYYWTQKKSS